jgi:glutamyl-tRNA reductase
MVNNNFVLLLGKVQNMENNSISKNPTFYSVGLSYKKADAAMRGKFSLDAQAKYNLLAQAKKEGVESLIVTSTCNRTEIYGFAQHPFQLIKLLEGAEVSFLFSGVKIDYYYSLTDSIQKRILFATQVNGVNYNPSIFYDLLEYKLP